MLKSLYRLRGESTLGLLFLVEFCADLTIFPYQGSSWRVKRSVFFFGKKWFICAVVYRTSGCWCAVSELSNNVSLSDSISPSSICVRSPPVAPSLSITVVRRASSSMSSSGALVWAQDHPQCRH